MQNVNRVLDLIIVRSLANNQSVQSEMVVLMTCLCFVLMAFRVKSGKIQIQNQTLQFKKTASFLVAGY